jgi:chromate transporter
MVVALSALYVSFGGLPWMQGAFYGVGAAVIAIIGRSANNLSKKTLKRDGLLWAIAVVDAATTALTRSEVVWLVVLGGFVTLAVRLRSSATPLAIRTAWVGSERGLASAETHAGDAILVTQREARAGVGLVNPRAVPTGVRIRKLQFDVRRGAE